MPRADNQHQPPFVIGGLVDEPFICVHSCPLVVNVVVPGAGRAAPKSTGARGDDASGPSRVNANRHVHLHARLEVRNRPFLAIYIDLGKRAHHEGSGFSSTGHRNRVCGHI